MRIEHDEAVRLEYLVRIAFNCNRGDMGGYIDADHFASNPFDAALIAIAPLWSNGDAKEIENFLSKWDKILRCNQENDVDIEAYIDDLKKIINKIK